MIIPENVEISWLHDGGVITAKAKVERIDTEISMFDPDGMCGGFRNRLRECRLTVVIDGNDMLWRMPDDCERSKESCRRIFDDESDFAGYPEHWL